MIAEGTSFFDTQADRWIGLYESRPAFKQRLELFTQSLAAFVPTPGPVLDFGCGPGVLSLALASKGYEVVGMDGAPRMIDMARVEGARRGISTARFEVMDASRLTLPPASFSAVVCSSVIEYVQDDAKLLGDLARAVRPGGHLFISVPHAGSMFGALEDFLAKIALYRRSPGRRHLQFSLRRYRTKEFSKALENVGVRPLDFSYFEAPISGKLGLAASRLPGIGVMLLVAGQKVS